MCPLPFIAGLYHYWLRKMVNSLQAGVREISSTTVESQVDAKKKGFIF